MKRDFVLHRPPGLLHSPLLLPPAPRALVVLAQLQAAAGNDAFAEPFVAAGYAFLALPLLAGPEANNADAWHNVPLIAQRLIEALDALRDDADAAGLPVALLAGGHVTPAAIRAAASRDLQVRAVVCAGGLPDLAGRRYLELLAAPLLLLAAVDDIALQGSCRRAAGHLGCAFEIRGPAPGEGLAAAALGWFGRHLAAV